MGVLDSAKRIVAGRAIVAAPELEDGRVAKAGFAGPPRAELRTAYLGDERRLVGGLIERAQFSDDEKQHTEEIARQLVHGVRAKPAVGGSIDAFMREYGLSSEEGVILMCIAESLLRIPDAATADRLIAEKIAGGSWSQHLGASDSTFVNASTWGLLLTGGVVRLGLDKNQSTAGDGGVAPLTTIKRLVARSGEPVIRQAVRRAVHILGGQFVLGQTIRKAIKAADALQRNGDRISYDMLGEAAVSQADAERYFARYSDAIEAIGRAAGPAFSSHPDHLMQRPGISIKLSALHPQFAAGKEERLLRELAPRVLELVQLAEANGVTVTLDAEEQDVLEPQLSIFADVFCADEIARWQGFGIAVQAYSKRAIPTLRWLRRLSLTRGKRIPLRLVKGAYWDTEIKRAQQLALKDYPVFTRKEHTDLSYLAATRLILSDRQAFYPQFATHNAQTLAAVSVAAGNAPCEYQRLYGMGGALYAVAKRNQNLDLNLRVYAPVGGHEDLLAYLVRRLLENGANSSFVNQIGNSKTDVATLLRDPIDRSASRLETADADPDADGVTRVMGLAAPRDIFKPRAAAAGLNLANPHRRDRLTSKIELALQAPLLAGPIVDGHMRAPDDDAALTLSPHDTRLRVGRWTPARPDEIEAALTSAAAATHRWDMRPADDRARILELAATMIERDHAPVMAALIREAGKTLAAAEAEMRETVDLLRFYGAEARRLFAEPISLPGPTGETNTLSLRGRGVFACIAPWNFPLAIFTGQVAAALAAGNTVIAKPAPQTPQVAALAIKYLHAAGVPKDALHLLTGGGQVGAALAADRRIDGIAFTGSNETAWRIQLALAERRAAIIPFIAETAGLNAMIADTSALPEAVVKDAVKSAFDSAGQRCSAARLLFLQDDIADKTLDMLAGATLALDIGDPLAFGTDVGPVIDEDAQDRLEGHKLKMQHEAREVADASLPDSCRAGTYVTPAVYEIDAMSKLKSEQFGPLLHVVRYGRGRLDSVINAINMSGYGLTLGLHSRLDAVANYVADHARVGNLYVNRDQIGAAVGQQPFGGEGLSGTGPKAGGPNYLVRFATERVRTTNITATGGNVELLRT